eukprot:1217599-Ditylum_brightwellii.AAC.1
MGFNCTEDITCFYKHSCTGVWTSGVTNKKATVKNGWCAIWGQEDFCNQFDKQFGGWNRFCISITS